MQPTFSILSSLLTTDIAVLARLFGRLQYEYKEANLVAAIGLRRTVWELAELAYDWNL